MVIYILILAALGFLVIKFDVNQEAVGYKFSYLLMLVILVCVAGLRYKIGSDTLSYMDEYKYLPSLSDVFDTSFSQTRYDFLWMVFCAACKSVTDSFFFMQFMHALIINSVYFYFFYKHTKYRFTAILIYYILGFLYFNTEILRESMAVAIFLLSLTYYYNRQWVKYYIVAVVSFLFHSSALIVFIFPLLSGIKFNKRFMTSLLGLIISAGIIWQLFNQYIDLLFVFSSIESKSKSYLNNELYVYNFNGMLYGLMTYTLIPLIAVFFYRRYIKVDFKEAPFVWLYIAFGVFIIYNNTIFARFQNYVFFLFLLFVCNLFNESYRIRRTISFHPIKVWTLFVLLSFGRYYNYLKPDITETTFIYQRYFPYHSILTMETTPERELLDLYW